MNATIKALCAILTLSALPSSALAQFVDGSTPRAYGFLDNGEVAIQSAVSYHFAPNDGLLVVNPNYAAETLVALGATIESDTTWLIDGNYIEVLLATRSYRNAQIPGGGPVDGDLPFVDARAVFTSGPVGATESTSLRYFRCVDRWYCFAAIKACRFTGRGSDYCTGTISPCPLPGVPPLLYKCGNQ